MKLYGLFLLLFAVGSILYQKVINPKEFVGERPMVLLRFAITDWGLIALALLIILFAPWSCEWHR